MPELEVLVLSNAQGRLTGRRGLVVDDEFLIVLDLQETLEDNGAAIVAAGSAEKALAALDAEGPFDFAVVDLHIGGALDSGLSVATALRERSIPFVFLSGLRSGDERVRHFQAPLVEKPYRSDVLIETIRQLLVEK